MKKLIYYSLLTLMTCTSILATEAVEDQIPNLQNLCVRKINGEIAKNSSFVIEWLEKPENHDKYDHQAIAPFFRLATETEDIPFFLLKKDNKEVYILGSLHTVPLYKSLTLSTVSELKRIARLKPIFYSEHESTNEEALQLLGDSDNCIEPCFLKLNFNFLFQIGLEPNVLSEFMQCSVGKYFMLNATESSNVELLEIAKSKLWLGALLLGRHANVLSYQKFGGLETELMHLWHADWQEIKYLETSPELLAIQKKHDKTDFAHNLHWSRKSIASIIPFLKSDEQTLRDINNKKWKEKLENYSWDVINLSKKEEIPGSAIERNELWADKLISFINSGNNISPLLIVVGDGHLAGYKGGWSLLSLLNKRLGYTLLRFSVNGGWKEVGRVS